MIPSLSIRCNYKIKLTIFILINNKSTIIVITNKTIAFFFIFFISK